MERRFLALFFLLGVFIFFALIFVRNPSASPTLRKAFIIVRYDQNKEEGVRRSGPGELTKKEKHDGYKLGRKLGVRYRKFLGYHYRNEEFTAYSISNENAMAVAQLLSSVLFPSPGALWWKTEKQSQTISVYPETFFNRTTCPRFYDDIVASRKDLQHLGMKNDSNGEDFAQDLGSDTVNFDDLTAIFLKFFRFRSYFFAFQRHLIAGPYFEKLITFFTKSSKKMELHLWNNMNILILLNILEIETNMNSEAPDAIAIELHKINGEDYFEITGAVGRTSSRLEGISRISINCLLTESTIFRREDETINYGVSDYRSHLTVYYISNSQTKPMPKIMPCGTSCPIADLISLSKDPNQEEYKELCKPRND